MSGVLTITRKIEFDYGHRVLGHEGKCRHLHGHHGVAEVTVRAPELDPLGRVVDFSVLKTLIKGWVDEHWDHNILLNLEDPQFPHFLETEERRPYAFEGNPTVELIARELFGVCQRFLPDYLEVIHVRVWETPSCHADYSEE